jgi:hypothetical protein
VPAFVTGIAPTQDVDELEKMLGSITGADRSKFVVLTSADRTDEHDDSFINFVHATTGGDEIIEGGGGTGVPGINGGPGLGYLSHPKVIQHVGNLPIPEDEADNYNDAIDNGRSVIAYPLESDAAAEEAAFKAAGLLHVKTFSG